MSYTRGTFAALSKRFDAAALGTVQFLASSLSILVEFVRYSEATTGEPRAKRPVSLHRRAEGDVRTGRHRRRSTLLPRNRAARRSRECPYPEVYTIRICNSS